jgi:hypothetical protein
MRGAQVTWMLATALGLALGSGTQPAWRLVLQSVLDGGLAFGLGRHPDVRHLLAALPRRAQVALACLLGALLAGQLAGRSVETFPFVRWDMYGTPQNGEPRYLEFTGIGADGVERPLNFAHAFRALNRQVMNGLERLDEEIDGAPDEAARRNREARFVVTVQALARRWNAGHPEAPVRRVRAWRVTVPLPFRGKDTIVRRLRREADVE